MHGRGCEERLAVRARDADVATPTQSTAPDAWCEATLYPRPSRLWGFELRRFLSSARGLERLVVGLRPDGEFAVGRLSPWCTPDGWDTRDQWPGHTGSA
jgi:hypothetical protein